MTTCRVQPGDRGESYGPTVIYGLEGIPKPAPSRTSKDTIFDVQGVAGKCAFESQVASGRAGAASLDRKTPFHCNMAAVIFMDDHNRRIKIMFFDSDHEKDGKPLGFEGTMQSDGTSLKVTHMYFLSTDFRVETGRNSECELFFENGKPDRFYCSANFRGGDLEYTGEVNFITER